MNQTLAFNEDFGHVLSPDTVQIKRVLPGPIERVWAYLTESDKRGQFREISLSVRSKPTASVRTRKGYYVPKK